MPLVLSTAKALFWRLLRIPALTVSRVKRRISSEIFHLSTNTCRPEYSEKPLLTTSPHSGNNCQPSTAKDLFQINILPILHVFRRDSG